MQFYVTTAVETTDELIKIAKKWAEYFDRPLINRKKLTVKQLNQQYGAIFIVYHHELQFVHADGTKLFFHPNTAMIRTKRMKEPLLDIIGKSPKNILDLTMGLASDAIVMSYAGHSVTAVEQNQIIHAIVSTGLQQYRTSNKTLNSAMQAKRTKQDNHLDYLKSLPSQSVDIIYLDPMFSYTIGESKNLDGIKPIACQTLDWEEVLTEARRVACEKIIVKAHYQDNVFERFGFYRESRKSAKFHFGYIIL